MKTKLLKHFSLRATILVALVCAAFTGAWAEKITDYTQIVSGKKYYIGATVSGTDYYFKTDGSTSKTGVQGTSVTDKAEAPVFTFEGSGTSWSIKFVDTSFYLSLASSKANGKVNIESSKQTWTASNASNLIHLTINDFCLQKNSGTSLNFGSYSSGQKDVWLEEYVASTGEATTTEITSTGITNTDLAAGTAAGTLSAKVLDASNNEIEDAEVTWSASPAGIASVADDGTVTLIKAGTTTITASYAGVEDTYQSSSDTYVLTVTNSNANDGSEAKPYTVAEARAAIDANTGVTNVYVKGIVCTGGSNLNNGALNYWISDDGTTTDRLEAYKGKNLNNTDFSATTDIQVGDIVTIYGTLTKYNSTYEFGEGSYLTSFKRKTTPELSFSEESVNLKYTEIAGFVAPTLTNTENVSVSYSSDNENVATVAADGTVTLKAVGTAEITASFDGDDDFKSNSTSYTITVSKGDANLSYATTVFTVSTSDAENFAAPTLVNPYNLTVTYSSSNEDFAFVDEGTGEIALDGAAGSAVITATFTGNENFNEGSASYTINVTAAAIYTATFNVNGEKLTEAEFAEGADIIFPDNAPASIGGLVFQGWSATEDNPVVLGTTQMDGTDATFYAVYGEKKVETTYEAATLSISNSDFTSALSGSYSTVTIEKTIDGESYEIELNACKQSNMCQMRDNATLSYIYIPELPGKITNISTTLCNNASGADYNGTIHIKSTKTRGNSDTNDIVKETINGNSFSIDVTGNNKSCYLFTSAGLRLQDLTVSYQKEKETITYTNLTTTISESVIVGETGYATYVTEHEVSFPTEVTAYIVTEVKENSIHLEEIADAPAGVPVIIEATEGEHALEFDYAGLYESAGTNLLQVSDGTITGSSTILALAKKNDVVGFYPVSSSITIPEGKAYLEVSSPVKDFLGFEGTETGISNMNAENVNGTIYNLAGQRVNHAQKGIFIVKGKKVVK